MREGWGLASKEVDGQPRLYATGGDTNLYVIDPVDWKTLSHLTVKQ